MRCASCGAKTTLEQLTCPECGAPQRRSGVRSAGSVLGSYRLIEVLGEGGMGVVYLAEHTRLGRRVALKTLRTDFAENPMAVRRFFGEARAVNKIRHQNIVEITDFVEEAGGDNYYIMELLRGKPLSNVIDNEGVQPLARTVNIMAQVARALQAVHDAGIIHRDLKPDNVFLIERGGQQDFVKLLDFGVAKLIDAVDSIGVSSTAAGAILGTPEYMSPEQASGKTVDHRTDIYSFGIMLYELVTGQLPLRGDNFGELVVKHLTITPTAPSRVPDLPHEVPAELEDAILACMEKNEDLRPDRIDIVGDQLEAIAAAAGWELPTYTAVPRATGRMTVMSAQTGSGPVSGPVSIAPLRRTPPKGVPALGHAPTLEIAPTGSGEMPALRAPSGELRSPSGELPSAASSVVLPTAPPAKRWPLYAAAAAVAVSAIAFLIVNLRGNDKPAPQAAPPVAAPTKPTAPVNETIEIEIVTTPASAEVVRASDGHVLGKTPLVLPFARADRAEMVEIRLAGYVAQKQSLRLDRGSRISTVLVPVPAETVAKPSRSRGKPTKKAQPTATGTPTRPAEPAKGSANVDRSGVMDPFK
ncbi:MAG TPA: serine/threonine-protein kinase [Kofleriaceae bacterium]|nr:serine/threonine-protein kinase [Kofleriaceae bacterium]